MSRKTRKLKNKLLVPFEWIGIGLGLCIIPWLPRAALFALCDGTVSFCKEQRKVSIVPFAE